MSGARSWFATLLLLGCKGHGAAAVEAGAPAADVPSSISSAATSPPAAASASGWLGSRVAVPEVPPPSFTTNQRFHKTTLSVDELTKLVTAAPELARVGKEVAFFDPGDVSYLTRSSADREDVTFTAEPLVWSPLPGRRALVVAAHGKTASFVAAWWMLPDGGYRLASSFVMIAEIAPIALAWRPGEGRTLWWTSCWRCPGETGQVSVREDGHIVIVQD